MELSKFWKVIPERDALDDLTQPQAQAIFRLLVLAASVDDRVTATERVSLGQALTRLPFFRPESWTMFEGDSGREAIARLDARYNADPVAVLGELRDSLGDEPTRVLALRMVALFLQPDGYAEAEHAFCMTVGQAFELDAEEVSVVLQDVVDWAES